MTLGYRPFGELSDMPWMPKSRYRVMRPALGARGTMAHDMMLMTATGQVSFDWSSEADCVDKVTAAVKAMPIVVALFANSPIAQGQLTGYQSFRSRVWNDVDPARCGYPETMLDGSMSYRSYVQWALQAPVLFLRRMGEYRSVQATFGQLLKSGFEGQPVTHSDWFDHLSTLFPEVRLKRVLEVRSADCNSVAMTSALAALMRGLLYDATARHDVRRLIGTRTPLEHRELHAAAQRDGLEAAVKGVQLAELARELVVLASEGLGRLGDGDEVFLEPLRELAAAGRSPARRVMELFERAPSPAAFIQALSSAT